MNYNTAKLITMETTFSITFSFKSYQGVDCFGRFFIGNDRDRASEIFQQLKGEVDVKETDVLFVDFVEAIEGLPTNLKIKSCTLAQLGENCKIITKEVFKLNNIEGGGGMT